MAWINVGGKVVNDPIKASDWNALYANFAAMAAGDPGAPEMTQAAMANNSIGQAQMRDFSIGQSEVKTALQSQTASLGAAKINIAFTGGAYMLGWGVARSGNSQIAGYSAGGYTWGIGIERSDAGATSYYFQGRYFTATKPYNLGNGDFGLMIYALIDNASGKVIAVDAAEDPPWHYNGPNRIDPRSVKTINGFKFVSQRKRVKKEAGNMDEYWDSIQNPVFEDVLIDHAMKNRDMNIIPHPFAGNDLAGKTVVLIDPTSALNDTLCCIHEDPSDDSVASLVMDGDIIIDRTALDYNAPNGVIVCAARKR